MMRDSQAGFTLVELLVVLTLTIIMLVTATSLFYTTLIGGSKTTSQEYTKQIGEAVMAQMTHFVRTAIKLVPNAQGVTCADTMESLSLQAQDLQTLTYSLTNQRIASGSSYLTPVDLSVSSLSFSCTDPGNGAPPRVTMRFVLSKSSSSNARDTVLIPFESSVTLRNK